MKLKKLVSPALAAILALTALAGCSGGSVSTGLGIATTYGGTHTVAATADKEGTAEIDSTIAVVTVDSSGKITKLSLDVAQTSAKFDASGQITSDLSAPVRSKLEKGADYGMAKVTGNKEWFEQAAEFEKWAVGKKVEDIRGLRLNAEGHLENPADVNATVSIGVSEFVEAVEKAVANKKEAKSAGSGYKTGLGVVTNYGGSHTAPATAEKDGTIEIDSTIAAVTIDKNGKICSLKIDVAQTSVKFDAAGQITSDVSAKALSKEEKGANYGMAKVTGNKEWFEQADAFEKWAIGKTVADLTGLRLNAEGHLENPADVNATVSIGVSEFIQAVQKAVANAK